MMHINEMLRPPFSNPRQLAELGTSISGPVLIALLGLAAIVGCAEEAPRHTELEWRGSFDTLANGAVLVRNPATPAWDSATAWRLEEELRIGGVEGPEPELFGGIAAVSADESGQIYVLEGMAQEIRVFAPDGAHLRTFGARGRGPGELRGAFGLVWDDRGRLWVADAGNARYTVFDRRGTLQGEYRRPLGPAYPFLGVFDESGRLLDVSANAGRGQLDLIPVSFSPDPPVFETWPAVTLPSYIGTLPRAIALLRPRLTLAFDRRGFVWFGTTDEYRIYQRSLHGDTLRIVERPAEPAPLSDSERAAMSAELAESQVRLDPNVIPTHKPAFNRFVLDDAGYLFVNLPDSEGRAGRLIDVFDPEGRYLGRMTAPVRLDWMVPPTITRNYLLGMARDELDTSYVVRLRLVRPER
ncbi:MAG: hypothetical protein PVJ64_13825 [Gemmatimonadales bacterium]|jgi:hypothetical protein